MKRLIPIMVLWAALMIFSSPAVANPEQLQAEPAIDTQVGWITGPNGMLIAGYDLDHNGRPDFFTVRIVVCHYFSGESLETLKTYHPGLSIFQVQYPGVDYFYVAQSHPLFYAKDTDEDGQWESVYRDLQEDGVNGNEILWESPFQFAQAFSAR